MKKNKKAGVFVGVMFIAVAVGAYLSGEASSLTSQGQIIIFGCAVFGLFTIIKNLDTKSKKIVESQPGNPQHNKKICKNCNRELSLEFVVCPYCGETDI